MWGEYDYTDLIKLYTQFMDEGREVYVMNYGLGNEQARKDDFQKIQDNFSLTLEQEGCHGACNIWSVKYTDEE